MVVYLQFLQIQTRRAKSSGLNNRLCGLAARAGGDMFIIDACQFPVIKKFKRCNDKAISVNVWKDSSRNFTEVKKKYMNSYLIKIKRIVYLLCISVYNNAGFVLKQLRLLPGIRISVTEYIKNNEAFLVVYICHVERLPVAENILNGYVG